jgi:hypothetical protein
MIVYTRNTHNEQLRRRAGIRLKSSMTIFAVDVFAGFLIAVLLFHSPKVVMSLIAQAHSFLNTEVLKAMVSWLMHSPVGLQLNENLAIFLGSISLMMMSYWEEIILLIGDLMKMPGSTTTLCMVLSLTSLFGASILLSVIVDVSAILSFHVLFVYAGLARFWKLWLEVAFSLTNLFRGKKYNILKYRTDGHEFDIEQLILGTVFLSISIFIMPTVFVFYVSFMTIWACILFLQFMIRTVIFFLTFFPGYLWLIAGSIPYETVLVPSSHRHDSVKKSQRSLPRGELFKKFMLVCCQCADFGGTFSQVFRELLRGSKLLFARYVRHDSANIDVSASIYASFYDRLILHMGIVTTPIDKLD